MKKQCCLIGDQKCLIWVFLCKNFKKLLSYFKSAPSNLSNSKIKKKKKPKLRTENASFGYFWAKILKSNCHIWNQHHQICLIQKFHEKNKNTLISDQKCLIWVFLGKSFKKLLSYLKLAPSNLANCKTLRKNKNA